MGDVAGHYQNFLAGVYTWLSGGAEARIAENRNFFHANGIAPRGGGNAVDLGCGSGFQSIPLAELGFAVTAIDLSDALLAELEARRAGLNITTVRADLLDFAAHIPGRLELAVCMGDTLTHLSGFGEVERLLRDVHGRLEEGGKLALTFRNLAQEVRRGDRFIPVRSDENAVFGCFLEYEGDFAIVHDILYTRGAAGWEVKNGFYKKLRISPAGVMLVMERIGYRAATLREERGLAAITAEK